MLTWIAAALFAAALLLFLRNRHHRQLGGLPSGELVSSDNAPEECPVLVSHRYGLKGNPMRWCAFHRARSFRSSANARGRRSVLTAAI